MQNPIVRQSSISALAMLAFMAVVFGVRFALAPFCCEMQMPGTQAPLAALLATLRTAAPAWSLAAATVTTIVAGSVVGRMCIRLKIYATRCFLPMPFYAAVACGIFMSANPLAAALASLMAAVAVNSLCNGYLKENNLTMMLYAGLCTGLLPMLDAAALPFAAVLLAAIPIFSFSPREITVLLASMLLVPAATCYVGWLCGGEFLQPLYTLAEAFIAPSGIETFGHDAAAALTLCGLVVYAALGSMVIFATDKFSIATKSRRILIYIMILTLASAALFLMPSSSPSLFAVAAVPFSAVMPVFFIKIGERSATLLYGAILLMLIIHTVFE